MGDGGGTETETGRDLSAGWAGRQETQEGVDVIRIRRLCSEEFPLLQMRSGFSFRLSVIE